MKIGHPPEKTLPVPATAAPAPSAEAARPASGPARAVPGAAVTDASAQVELSSTAATLLSSGTAAEFDADKVARMSQAIAGGTYKVNPDVIADKLIANAHELLAKVKG